MLLGHVKYVVYSVLDFFSSHFTLHRKFKKKKIMRCEKLGKIFFPRVKRGLYGEQTYQSYKMCILAVLSLLLLLGLVDFERTVTVYYNFY